jgi:hypothetical protein
MKYALRLSSQKNTRNHFDSHQSKEVMPFIVKKIGARGLERIFSESSSDPVKSRAIRSSSFNAPGAVDMNWAFDESSGDYLILAPSEIREHSTRLNFYMNHRGVLRYMYIAQAFAGNEVIINDPPTGFDELQSLKRQARAALMVFGRSGEGIKHPMDEINPHFEIDQPMR